VLLLKDVKARPFASVHQRRTPAELSSAGGTLTITSSQVAGGGWIMAVFLIRDSLGF
jgi:hypothetical protein